VDEKKKTALIAGLIVVALIAVGLSLKYSFFNDPPPVPNSRGAAFGEKMKQGYQKMAEDMKAKQQGGGQVGQQGGAVQQPLAPQ
jgi:hypothetical protein